MTKTYTSVLLLGSALLAAESNTSAADPVSTNKWEQSVAAGLTLTKGNSDTLLGTLNYLGAKKWDQNEMRVGADAAYGENNSVRNNGMARAYGQYNRLFTESAFGYVRLEGLHDAVADVDYRFTLSPGAGYYFIKNARTVLSAEAGPGLVHEKQGGVEKTYITARLAERFEFRINERARIWQSLEFLPQVDDFNNFLINAELGIEVDIAKNFALRAFVVDSYDNEPAPGRKENDVKLGSAVAYKF